MKIIINGPPRSGTTLVGQLVKAINPDTEHTHPAAEYSKDADYYVITMRHPFDVAASRYRVRLSRDPNTGGAVGLEAELATMKTHYDGIVSIPQPNTMIKYEQFYCDYSIIFDLLSGLGMNVTFEQQCYLTQKYSQKMNKLRAKGNFNQINEDGIHGEHLGGIHPGSWVHTLPSELHEQMLTFCEPIAREWGYV